MRLLTKIIAISCLVFLVHPKETPSIYQHKTGYLQKGKMKRGMNFSDQGIDLLKHLEGYKETPYLDSGKNASIGYGHKIKSGELFVTVTESQAEALLRKDIAPLEKFINDHLKALITQNQFDALLIFIYNIGPSAFLESHVYQYLKNKQYEAAMENWAKWVNVSQTAKEKGKLIKRLIPVKGLINRRAAEIDLFNT